MLTTMQRLKAANFSRSMKVPQFPVCAGFSALLLLPLAALAAGEETWQLGVVNDEGKAEVENFKRSVTKSIAFPDLEFDSHYKGPKGERLGFNYSVLPDFKREVLRYGLAKLKDFKHATRFYQDGQMEGMVNARGMWRDLAILEFEASYRNSPEKRFVFDYDSKIDFRLEILKSGAGKLRNFAEAEVKYQNVQMEAIENHVGLWSSLSDIIFDESYIKVHSKRSILDFNSVDLRLSIIQSGVGRLKLLQKATERQRDAQIEAMIQKRGMWAEKIFGCRL